MRQPIRVAAPSDLDALIEIDESISAGLKRGDFFRRAIEERNCYVFDSGGVQAYLIFSHKFFDHGFISLCAVNAAAQGRGIGTALIRHAESLCNTDKLFSSTNESNQRMRKLFVRLGFQESGRVENLDPGDPEIFYFKLVR